jgi:hypothetical protein
MTSNPYAAAPLYAAAVNPATGLHTRAFFFLGAVPRAVLAAARRAHPSRGDPRRPEWTVADAAILRGHYGASWRTLLTAEDPPPPELVGLAGAPTRTAPTFFTGGDGVATARGGDSASFDDFDEGTAPEEAQGAARSAPAAADSAAGPPTYTDLAVYPEDTIFELRLKLSVAAGVPMYRQHFFYYVNEEGPALPYRFTLDGAPVLADWRALARAPAESTAVAGVVVDSRFEERREGIRIEALDTFTALAPVSGVRVTRAYYVDLFGVIPPLGTPERPNDGLPAVLRDRYQFDLLYYGALLRYWPHLSPDACNAALSAPARVAEAYPALDPDPAALRARFEAERALADRALAWRPAAAAGGRAATAVTEATVQISPQSTRVRVAIRNVFDWIPTGDAVAAARARFDIDAALLTEAGAAPPAEATRLGGAVPVIATKRHASSYGTRADPTIGWFVERPPRRDSVSFALARGAVDAAASSAAIPFAFLTVFADGRAEATADWREDDRVGFGAVTAEMAAIVAPTFAAINAMGAAAFPVGGELASSADGALTTLGAITASAFWPHALSAAAFREVKGRFRAYEKAGIVGIRGLQQAGAYAFAFRRGVVAYDPRAADRAEAAARGKATIQNQYTWLTDAGAAARWEATFQGRAVRIYHRATDLRVEIVGADSLAEFELIRRYLFSFLDGILTGPDRIAVEGTAASRREATPRREAAGARDAAGRRDAAGPPDDPRRLRRLQERDPNLFDLKKYDREATVYSVLCQSGRQPSVYNGAEHAKLDARRRGAAVRYWNFTENEPAFYECPDPKYPHLSFRSGIHPLGYCLPCCKKMRPAAGSRAALANEGCLERRAPAAAPEEDAPSRHILAYGKAVPPGRISELPREVGEGLFLGALAPPYRLQLVGVEQAAPAVPEAGFAYALAEAIGLGDETPAAVFAELAALATAMGDTFYALGGGGGAVFASAHDLADAILGAFVRRDPDLSPLGPGGAAAAMWPAILADLARYAYGVEVVTLVDPTGTGAVTLEVAADAAAAISAAGAGGASRIRIAVIAAGPAGTYPVAAMDPRAYSRVVASRRWAVARRTFVESGADPDPAGPAFAADRVVEVVRGALASRTARRGAVPDLGLVTRASAATAATIGTIETRLANLGNLCYGVILRRPDGRVYIPVRGSAYPVDGTPVTFGPRPRGPLPPASLAAAVADLNRFIAGENAVVGAESYAMVERAATIVDAEGRAIGFATPGDDPLHFFHDAVSGPVDGPTIVFPYDSLEVDAAIVATIRGAAPPPEDAEVRRRATAAAAQNRLYRLFLAEFSAALRADRDTAMRAAIAAALKETRYDSAQSLATLRRRLVGLLRDRPDDLALVRDAVARAYRTAPRDPGAAALAAVEATRFGFDRRTLRRLRDLTTHDEVVAALRALMGERVSAAAATIEVSNMYVACAEGAGLSAPHCAGPRLLIRADRLDDFYDILAADVQNPGKAGLLAAVSAGVFDPLDFIRRPAEHLAISLGAR